MFNFVATESSPKVHMQNGVTWKVVLKKAMLVILAGECMCDVVL